MTNLNFLPTNHADRPADWQDALVTFEGSEGAVGPVETPGSAKAGMVAEPNTAEDSSAPSNQLVDLLDRLNIGESITPAQSKAELDKMTDDDFLQLLLVVNGIIRDMPVDGRSFDGEGSVVARMRFGHFETDIKLYDPPLPADRLPLMLEAFHAAQTVRDPATAGLVLELGVNFTHIFADGNGRSGRFLHSLLARGYGGSEADRMHYTRLLENETGRAHGIVNIEEISEALTPEFVADKEREIADRAGYTEELPTLAYSGFAEQRFKVPVNMFDRDYYLYTQPMDESVRSELIDVMNCDPEAVRDLALFAWLLKTNQTGEDFIDTSELAQQRLMAQGSIFLDRGISEQDAQELIAQHRQLQCDFVRYVIRTAVELYADGTA